MQKAGGIKIIRTREVISFFKVTKKVLKEELPAHTFSQPVLKIHVNDLT